MEAILFCGLSVGAWITIAVILIMFGVMIFTKLPADLVFMGGMTALFVSGVLSAKEALAGFSSTSVVTIGVLFVVIAGLVHTGFIQWIVKYVLGVPGSYPKAVVRLMLPVAALSSFLSNTTVVALFLNVVKVWAKKLKIAPSKLLIPLSYASGMGGICTLIGTPPNLIVSGFYMSDTGTHLNIFTTTLPGLFCLVVGVLSVLALRRLLPNRKSPEDSFEATSEYTVELLVPTECESVGKTVEEAGLKNVNGGHLIEIVRFDREIISPVPADEYVLGGDRLVYSGQIDEILNLKKTHGLANATHHLFSLNEVDKNRKLRTASVEAGSSLIGKRMSETNFEDENEMVLVAVARKGERIDECPREIALKFGDTLLLETAVSTKLANEAASKARIRFFDSEEIPNIGKQTIVSAMIMLAMVLLSTFDIIPLLQSCFLAAFAMIVAKCCTVDQARDSIDWSILMIFAGSVCLGTAIEKTGIATQLVNGILNVCGTNPYVVLSCICLVATFITEFISNTACAAMFYPIAYHAAVTLNANPLTFCIALMIAVSSSFATPIGSPTHMLVYGVGGYRFTDFMKIGLLMNFIILAANIFIVTLLFPM
ncbi:MAG: SLC13 family permease [Bacteroidales bacterium]|nr:SLC13 family permease [Bacteroidales bacterium]